MNRDLEKGSALLIVFVFAAIIAIMLYKELPVAVFEARRQKEQLLVDRGNEYVHAIRLYVRKIGKYPPSIDALEDTNRMRFLRHKFKDPFTGKDDWRLLHAGPGGMLLDSKVSPPNLLSPNGNNQSSGSTSASTASSFGSSAFSSSSSNGANGTFGSSLGSSLSSSNSFSSSSSKDAPDMVVPPLPQRGPAIVANGAGSGQAGNGAEGDLSSGVAPTPDEVSQQAEQGLSVTLNTAGEPGGLNANGQPQASGTSPAGTGAGNQAVAGSGDQTGATNAGTNGSTRNGVGLNGSTSNGPGTGIGTGTGTGIGAGIVMGGVAGVASKAQGPSIKVINDQTDYSLWEFYYNPQNDTLGGAPGAMGGNALQPGATPQNGSTSTFGQPAGNSFGFGSSSTNAPAASVTGAAQVRLRRAQRHRRMSRQGLRNRGTAGRQGVRSE